MTTAAVSDRPEGYEHRTFECLKCTVTETRTLASDPLKSDALRWLSGELVARLRSPLILAPSALLVRVHPNVRRDLARLGQLDHVHRRRVAALLA